MVATFIIPILEPNARLNFLKTINDGYLCSCDVWNKSKCKLSRIINEAGKILQK